MVETGPILEGYICLKCHRTDTAYISPSGMLVLCIHCPWTECVPMENDHGSFDCADFDPSALWRRLRIQGLQRWWMEQSIGHSSLGTFDHGSGMGFRWPTLVSPLLVTNQETPAKSPAPIMVETQT
jgi:hypothetical protein